MSLLHSRNIGEVNLLSHYSTVLGNDFIIVLNLLTLIHKGGCCLLATFVNDYWSDSENSLWMEVSFRICNCE